MFDMTVKFDLSRKTTDALEWLLIRDNSATLKCVNTC